MGIWLGLLLAGAMDLICLYWHLVLKFEFIGMYLNQRTLLNQLDQLELHKTMAMAIEMDA